MSSFANFKIELLCNRLFFGALALAIFTFSSIGDGYSIRSQRLYPFISAQDEEVSDFAFSLATITSNILDQEVGGSGRWNVAFFSGENLLNANRINVAELGIKDEKLIRALHQVKSDGQKCVVQEFSQGEGSSLVVGIASYNQANNNNNKICFVVMLAYFYQIKEFSPAGKLSASLIQLLRGLSNHVRN